MKYLIQNIFFLRKKYNITQQRLADDIGIKRSSVCAWEDNRKVEPSVQHLKLLSDYFEVSIHFLVLCDLRIKSEPQCEIDYLNTQKLLKLK
jgi:transcriptional regulator with XRE-family HTH domain